MLGLVQLKAQECKKYEEIGLGQLVAQEEFKIIFAKELTASLCKK